MRENHVLVLSHAWQAVDTCTVYKAFSKAFAEQCEFLDTETYVKHDISSWLMLPVFAHHPRLSVAKGEIRAPEVMILSKKDSFAPRQKIMQYSRRNLLRRDLHACQYCGDVSGKLTIDHIVPRVKGGKTSWLNCVMACLDCNSNKGHKTLKEANMTLLPRPDVVKAYPDNKDKWNKTYEPLWSPVFRVPPDAHKPSWSKFLPDSAMVPRVN